MTESAAEPARLRFGIFELDIVTGELRRAGSLVRLPPQPFRILALLACRHGQLITREEIQKEIWGSETFVDFDQGLNFAIKKIRDALGDDAETPRYIETLPRRGYRFIALTQTTPPLAASSNDEHHEMGTAPDEARLSMQDSPPTPSTAEVLPARHEFPDPSPAGPKDVVGSQELVHPRPGWRTKLTFLALIVAGLAILLGIFHFAGLRQRLSTALGTRPAASGPRIESLAVLPFLNAAGDPDAEYLADGLTEALINRLSEMPHLTIMSRSAVLRYKGQEPDPRIVARDLHIQAVLTGRVIRRGDDIRISTELIDARDGRHVWGEQYHRKLGELIAINGQMASAISGQLRLSLTPEAEEFLGKRFTESTDAYQMYLRGVTLVGSYRAGGAAAGIKYLQEATMMDPQFALAYAALATAYVQANRPAEARPPAERALALDDSLGEAHRALAMIKCWQDWDWVGCEQEFQRAIALNPNDSHAYHYYSHFLEGRGRFDQALAAGLKALELDPLSPAMNTHLGSTYIATHRPDEAIERLQRAVEIDPNFASAHQFLGDAYLAKDLSEKAVAEYLKSESLNGETPENVAGLETAFHKAGLRGFRLRQLELAKARWKRSQDNASQLARLCALLDLKDQALLWLKYGFERRALWLIWVGSDPAYESIRSDPRFQELLRRMNFPP